MPRRKGQGISPTKRVANKDGSPQARKKTATSPERLGEIQPTPTKAKSDDHNSKYLHKKFKKMATACLQQASESRASLPSTQPEEILDDLRSLVPIHEAIDEFNVSCNNQSEDEPLELASSLPGKYVCSYCKLICAKPSVLQKHIRAHTNERPYPCIPCGFAFKTKSNLYKHCRSRAHALKMDEHGTKLTFPLEESSEDDENNSIHSNNNTPPPADEIPPHEPGTPQHIISVDSPEKRPIYKPKFHKAAMYHEEEHALSQSPKKSPNLSVKIPVPNLSTFSSMGGLSKTPTSLSPEFLQRHISKIISENQAIVETMDMWPKKRQRDRDGSPASPLSASSSPSGDPLHWPKKLLQRQMSSNEFSTEERIKTHQMQSKLATALLKPPPTPDPSMYMQQPLNLTTNHSKDAASSFSRKRCFSEGFSGVQTKQGAILKDHTVENVLNNRTQNSKGRSDHLVSEVLPKNIEKLFHPQNPEGSIIKDLLLKARAASAAGLSIQDGEDYNLVSSALSVDEALNVQHVCHLCKIPYRNAENLEIHQLYYCKGDEGIDAGPQATLSAKGKPKLDLKISPVKDGSQISQPFPSPGPLLGNTPLVESYCFGQAQKKQRLDCEATTLRSLEELSKCPMRSNSLQMFGGEVSILDGAGETKTMRIEPRGKSPSATEYMNMPNSQQSGVMTSDSADNSGNNSPHMVVTIARSGLNSGGTIVQVPLKTSTSSSLVKPPRSSGGSVRSSPSPITLSPLQTPPKHSLSSSPNVPNSFPNTPKLLAPLVPNITTPNLSVPGIPAPSLDHHLPFVPFASILPDGTLLNPLTNITAFNPLTLPPLRSKECGNGVVAILHGGKVIPYVQGMPGPQSLSTSLPITMSSPKPLNLASPSKEQLPIFKIDSPQNKDLHETHATKSKLFKSSNSTNSQCTVIASSHRNPQQRESPSLPGTPRPHPARSTTPKTWPPEQPTTLTDGQDVKRLTQASRKVIATTNASIRKESVVNDVVENEKPNIETEVDAKNDPSRSKFLRPTSLPLKPGTFVPKQHPSPGYGNVLSLVSPETPRPKKSYGQLYLNGHAYTYLGLKCSTRPFYCTLNRTQPMYVPQSPDHAKISMYSNWKICSEADPTLLGLDAGKALALYDCRHRSSMYTVAVSSNKPTTAVTHSSYWSSRRQGGITVSEKGQNLPSGEPSAKRVKIFDGGFESNEDYIYVRGRGRGRYVCEECGIRCKKPSMLKKHIRTHTDVRPFTCRHCTFSFKTKGNLTKHMKSKAHYKKCVELGILPVPTAVDDSYVDEDCLARQQALRASRRRAASDGDETDSEDDDEEEDEDDEDDEDDDDLAEENTLKGRLEREAARSLLSLSVVPDPRYLALGLLPQIAHSRPATYPYQQLSAELGSLDPEEASKTASGVSSWLGPTGEKNRCYFPSVRHSPPTSPSGRENTLSPTSSTSPHSPCSSSSKLSPRPVESIESLDKVDLSRDLELGKNNSLSCLEIKPEICMTSVKDTYDTTFNWVSKVVGAKARGVLDLETSEDDSLGPMDLSNKRVSSVQKLCSRPTPLSILLPPVLVASSTESPNPTLFPGDGAETTMLHAYLTEKALQHARIKQHQKKHPTVPILHISREATKDTWGKKEISTRIPTKVEKDVATEAPNSVSSNSEREEETSGVESGVEAPKTGANSKPKESLSESVCCMLRDDDVVRNVVLGGFPYGGGDPSVGRKSPTGGVKAEFMPPASGPSPSYVSVLEDGRSICVICNKIFSKPSQLRLHVNIHYFERPFRCEACAVSFRTRGHLQKHERSSSHQNKVSMNSTFGTATMTNPRPFKCSDCKIAFRIHGHLAKHLRSKMHIMKLECVGKLPFGTYAEMEREGVSLNEIDTSDCDNSLESLQVLAQKLYEKDPSKLGQWDGDLMRDLDGHRRRHPSGDRTRDWSGGDSSSEDGEPWLGSRELEDTDTSDGGDNETTPSQRSSRLPEQAMETNNGQGWEQLTSERVRVRRPLAFKHGPRDKEKVVRELKR